MKKYTQKLEMHATTTS
jgi:hypothetical protein